MKQLLASLFAIHMLFHTGIGCAYDPATHRDLSGAAVEASRLRIDPALLSDLGLQSIDALGQTFLNSRGEAHVLKDVVRDGAEFEDDGRRARNHFYDPVHNRPLTAGVRLGETSPDWALEDKEDVGQAFSFQDARAAFHKALTLPDKAEREQSFGRTFQTLGHVIHHLQDMAQPQHVRNDVHLDVPDVDIPFIENPSLYKKYTNRQEVRRALPFSGYAPVSFDTARKFWATGTGQGITEFTNHNFVSAGTNFRGPIDTIQSDPDYRFPNGHDAQRTVKRIEDPDLLGSDQPLRGQMVFIGTPVNDLYVATTTFNTRTSTYSIFDPDLTEAGAEATFTLNSFNFKEAYKFLLPRAVAYSAGLINYFFRGKIDFTPDPHDSDRYVIKNLGNEDMNGTFKLYYDDEAGNRHDVPDAEWTVAVAKQSETSVPGFAPPSDPAPKKPGRYMLVFTGHMGEEQPVNGSVGAVIGKQVTLHPLAFLIVTASSTYK